MNHRLSILILGACVVTTHACAQPSQRGRALVDQLKSEHWLDRDQAMRELTAFNDEFSLDDLEFFLADQTLSLEQRARLMQACLQRFREHPKGGLGVAFGATSVGSIEVVPIENNPNFPASKMLLLGDAIASVDGVMMKSSYDLRAQIVSREPGEMLPVTVIRAGKLIEMNLPLGSFTKLTGTARLDQPLAKRALELRWARKGILIEHPDTIGLAITLEQWTDAVFPSDAPANLRSLGRTLPAAMIAGAQRLIAIGQYAPRRIRTWKSLELLEKEVYKLALRDAQVMLRIQRARRDLQKLRHTELLAELDGAATDAEKAQIKNGLAALKAEIQTLDEEIAELEPKSTQTAKPLP